MILVSMIVSNWGVLKMDVNGVIFFFMFYLIFCVVGLVVYVWNIFILLSYMVEI